MFIRKIEVLQEVVRMHIPQYIKAIKSINRNLVLSVKTHYHYELYYKEFDDEGRQGKDS